MSVTEWVVGLASIAVGIVGLFVAKTVRSRRQSQSQRVGRDGVGIQSGRDTKIG